MKEEQVILSPEHVVHPTAAPMQQQIQLSPPQVVTTTTSPDGKQVEMAPQLVSNFPPTSNHQVHQQMNIPTNQQQVMATQLPAPPQVTTGTTTTSGAATTSQQVIMQQPAYQLATDQFGNQILVPIQTFTTTEGFQVLMPAAAPAAPPGVPPSTTLTTTLVPVDPHHGNKLMGDVSLSRNRSYPGDHHSRSLDPRMNRSKSFAGRTMAGGPGMITIANLGDYHRYMNGPHKGADVKLLLECFVTPPSRAVFESPNAFQPPEPVQHNMSKNSSWGGKKGKGKTSPFRNNGPYAKNKNSKMFNMKGGGKGAGGMMNMLPSQQMVMSQQAVTLISSNIEEAAAPRPRDFVETLAALDSLVVGKNQSKPIKKNKSESSKSNTYNLPSENDTFHPLEIMNKQAKNKKDNNELSSSSSTPPATKRTAEEEKQWNDLLREIIEKPFKGENDEKLDEPRFTDYLSKFIELCGEDGTSWRTLWRTCGFSGKLNSQAASLFIERAQLTEERIGLVLSLLVKEREIAPTEAVEAFALIEKGNETDIVAASLIALIFPTTSAGPGWSRVGWGFKAWAQHVKKYLPHLHNAGEALKQITNKLLFEFRLTLEEEQRMKLLSIVKEEATENDTVVDSELEEWLMHPPLYDDNSLLPESDTSPEKSNMINNDEENIDESNTGKKRTRKMSALEALLQERETTTTKRTSTTEIPGDTIEEDEEYDPVSSELSERKKRKSEDNENTETTEPRSSSKKTSFNQKIMLDCLLPDDPRSPPRKQQKMNNCHSNFDNSCPAPQPQVLSLESALHLSSRTTTTTTTRGARHHQQSSRADHNITHHRPIQFANNHNHGPQAGGHFPQNMHPTSTNFVQNPHFVQLPQNNMFPPQNNAFQYQQSFQNYHVNQNNMHNNQIMIVHPGAATMASNGHPGASAVAATCSSFVEPMIRVPQELCADDDDNEFHDQTPVDERQNAVLALNRLLSGDS